MFKYLRKKKAQSTLEYVILIIVIIAALLAIQVYLKRGLMGRIRQAADDIGEQFDTGSNFNETVTTTTYSRTNETFISGTTRKELLEKEYTNRTFSGGLVNSSDAGYWGQ